MTTAAVMKRNNNSDGVFLDSDRSNEKCQQWEETATAIGGSDKQQEMAATVGAITAKAVMAERAGRAATVMKATPSKASKELGNQQQKQEQWQQQEQW